MRLLIFFLALTFIITTYSKRPWSKPWRPWSSGKKCTKRVTSLCKKKCIKDEYKCENLNRKEPKQSWIEDKKKNKKKIKKYCNNLQCVKSVEGEECSCPMK